MCFFAIYGHGGHLTFRTVTICINCQYPLDRRLHKHFEANWPRGFRGEVFRRCGRTTEDGRRMESDNNSNLVHPEPSA